MFKGILYTLLVIPFVIGLYYACLEWAGSNDEVVTFRFILAYLSSVVLVLLAMLIERKENATTR
jgi:hypothetical protein